MKRPSSFISAMHISARAIGSLHLRNHLYLSMPLSQSHKRARDRKQRNKTALFHSNAGAYGASRCLCIAMDIDARGSEVPVKNSQNKTERQKYLFCNQNWFEFGNKFIQWIYVSASKGREVFQDTYIPLELCQMWQSRIIIFKNNYLKWFSW